MIHIAITNQQSREIDEDRLRLVVQSILAAEGLISATVPIAVVDDATIHRLNRQYLQHDRPTDVLSFLLDRTASSLDGEVIVSAETAASAAGRFGWTAADELLLYVVHGTLHLVGYLDQSVDELAVMRERERHFLSILGLHPRYSAAKRKPAPRHSVAPRRLRHASRER